MTNEPARVAADKGTYVFELLTAEGISKETIEWIKDQVITKKHCLQCDHEWWPEKPGRPLSCPSGKCSNPFRWDRERRRPRKAT